MATSFSFLKNRKNPDLLAKRREILTKRREGDNGNMDFIFTKKVNRFQVKDGGTDHCVRILPASWEDAEDYGVRIFAHYNIGLNKSAFLCLEKMNRGNCPICEGLRTGSYSDKEAEALKARFAFLMWVIDRSDASAGPKLWSAPSVVERQLAQTAYDKKTDTYLFYDDIEEGFDINFIVNGKKPYIKYESFKPDRNPSPLGDPEDINKWLKFVEENPIPNLLNFKDEDHIRKVMQGKVENAPEQSESSSEEVKEEKVVEEKKETKPGLKLVKDEPKEESKKTSTSKLNSEAIQKMDRDEVINVVNSLHLSVDPSDWPDTDDLKEAVKVELSLN